MAETSELRILINAHDNASHTLRGFGNTLTSISNQAKIASGIVAASLGILGKSAISSAAEMEQNAVAFQTMLGSQEKAGKLMKEISDFARKTPFELPGVVSATRQLLAYGSSAEDVISEIQMLGDASGGNAQRFDQLALAFGQVRAKTRLAGQEMLQFTNAGVGLREELSKRLGISIADVDKKMEEGGITFNDVKEVLKSMTSEGGRFFNLMNKQSQTFTGTMSNINDNFGRMVRGIVGINEAGEIRKGSIFEVFKNGATNFLKVMDEITPKIIEFVDALSQNKEAVAILAGALLGALAPALFTAAGAAGTLMLSLAPFIALGALVAVAWVQNWGDIQTKVQEVVSWLQTSAIPVATEIFNTFKDGWGDVQEAISNFWGVVEPIFNDIKESLDRVYQASLTVFGDVNEEDIKNFVKVVGAILGGAFLLTLKAVAVAMESMANSIERLSPVMKAFVGVAKFFVEWASKAVDLINKIPGGGKVMEALIKTTLKATNPANPFLQFSQGGFVPGKLGQPQLAMVHGGEKIMSPNMQDVNNNVGGVVINMSGNFSLDSEQRVDELARRITQIMGRQTELAKIGVEF